MTLCTLYNSPTRNYDIDGFIDDTNVSVWVSAVEVVAKDVCSLFYSSGLLEKDSRVDINMLYHLVEEFKEMTSHIAENFYV